MRLIEEEETAANNKLIAEWWSDLDYSQQGTLAGIASHLKDIPDRKRLCLKEYPTGEMSYKYHKKGNPIYAICLETAVDKLFCKKHALKTNDE